MSTVPVAVLGAGQAGLAVSRLLTGSGVEHVVLDRGRPAETWRARPWESLRLLTPNWMSRLPGWSYRGLDEHGFMTAREVAAYLAAYARSFAAPVVGGAELESVRPAAGGYRVDTAAGSWTARTVVVATGWCQSPAVPDVAGALDPRIAQETAASYRSPAALPGGRVLVVGASASGVQLADELAAAGRDVVLATGAHTRLPRTYRGLDILWWLSTMGVFDREFRATGGADPSLQLIGRPDRRDVDLPALQRRGVSLAGRVVSVEGSKVRFAHDLPETTAAADARMSALLHRIDAYAHAVGLDDEIEPLPPPLPAARTDAAAGELDLAAAGFGTVLWATGYRRDYPWLHVPVLDAAGEIRHVRGDTPAPGLHVVGMRRQTRRSSTFLDGVRHDAALVVDAVLAELGATRSVEVAA
ncbi:flavin-containing monooxygenase [Petropleomorpha daqingensis]|uniref:Putative flavoprotein involved in K+ transport n=1 Tax=Petropleomorpha daqingensis TaxID=2026353 RepID=A0A853CPG1_9ACTN|nr:NAD(P)/FAD-dependent oxidoreductase [Petropleomorpha daqingensis]NYJ08392.1 putative flavoprotein involved in K+ transport [Petropleomorpha daqingensis]